MLDKGISSISLLFYFFTKIKAKKWKTGKRMSLKEKKTWCKSTWGLKEKPKLKEKFLVKVFTEGEKVV